ncbi:hypothetical protein NSA47_02855 [Irregularibacter muris]|uniref:Uncharacterized protein n=1 Tax=Irregularibacter muris TaxID=1796619 RepID=A0AAE3HDC7_9FIRM|nr:hypothetical protein [Irregularibacter muris]MCR1897926.1 hypothetical protein [Irregularibacter muris]
MAIIANLTISLLILVGIIWLQVFLSKNRNKWLGLIFPAIGFFYSLLMIFSIVIFKNMSAWDIFGLIASTFLLSNIPTIILLAIYFACRGKIKRNDELDKMNIQDLE